MTSERPKSSRPSRFPIAMAAAIPTLMGCSAPSEHPSSDVPYSPPPGQQIVNSVAHGSCNDGDERKCSVILGTYDGIVSCFVGVQFCSDNVWGPCQDPATGAPAPSSGGAGGQAAGGSAGTGAGGGDAPGGAGGVGGAG